VHTTPSRLRGFPSARTVMRVAYLTGPAQVVGSTRIEK
jgi:hypothetical protein